MKNAQKITELNAFLAKVRQLRGFGDMDSFQLVNQMKSIAEITPDAEIDNIIQDLCSPQTYNAGKDKFARHVETLIVHISKG